MIRPNLRPRPTRTPRRARPRFDHLEAREVLSAAVLGPVLDPAASQVARPMFAMHPDSGSTPTGGYAPSQLLAAYGFSSISFDGVAGTGAGETIAIVDAYNDPKIASDLATFDAEYGLPSANLGVVNETGGTTLPGADSTGGWEMEESLDVEWAHAIAPGAKIVLVEASSPTDSDLLAAVTTASTTLKANVVSMSWGGPEFNGETTYDSIFSHPGVVYTVSSGDTGAPISWPAASSNVLAVGGTTLTTSGNAYGSEAGWSGSGGGPSAYENQPSYQSGVVTQTTARRANPDVSYDADPNTGYSVYDSVPYYGQALDWLEVGGTSAGAPQWAALTAIADQGRAAAGLPAINATSPTEIQTDLYKNTSAFHDITGGNSTGSPSYSAGAGFDYVTGVGSPMANRVVQALDGSIATTPADHLVVTGASTDVAGGSYTLTVTAETANNVVDPSYTGTVALTSNDPGAALPASHTFVSADHGTYRFTVVLKTAGTRSITATDATTGAASATDPGIVVSPAAASQLVITGLGQAAGVGSPVAFTVTAKDQYGNVATGYAGTVTFASADPAAVLPASHKFTTSNQGVFQGSVTFKTAGSQAVTASDGTLSVSSAPVVVSPSGTITLVASAASTSSINLSWNAIAGATGYVVQRSTNGGGWTQVASTSASVTTDVDAGLASGTAYSYRVEATGGNGSPFSNVAAATTSGSSTGGGSGGALTLWPNSSVPVENAYSFGSYELGVKIRVDVTGQVTAIRFYKEAWMGGVTHVGHLWSPTGTLLATATFTNETSSGWEQVNLSTPVTIAANSAYVVSFSTGGGLFGFNTTGLKTSGVDDGVLHALANTVQGGDGVYGQSGHFPTNSGNGDNFFADVVFAPTSGANAHAVAALEPPQVGPILALTNSTAGATVTPASTSASTPRVQVGTAGAWVNRRVAFAPAAGQSRFGSFDNI